MLAWLYERHIPELRRAECAAARRAIMRDARRRLLETWRGRVTALSFMLAWTATGLGWIDLARTWRAFWFYVPITLGGLAAAFVMQALAYFALTATAIRPLVWRAMCDRGMPTCCGCGYSMQQASTLRCTECGAAFRNRAQPERVA